MLMKLTLEDEKKSFHVFLFEWKRQNLKMDDFSLVILFYASTVENTLRSYGSSKVLSSRARAFEFGLDLMYHELGVGMHKISYAIL